MNKPTLRSATWMSLLAAAALLVACAKNPAGEDTSAKDNETASAAQAKSDSEASAMLLPAYELNRDASSRQRLTGMKATASEPTLTPDGKIPTFGAPPAPGSASLAAKPRPMMANALLKRSALGKQAASAGPDSTYFVYDDSSSGHILWVHEYEFAEAGATVKAIDTLTYKWPYSLTDRTVLGHKGSRAYANGARMRYVVSDQDGDGILNEAIAGKKIRLLKTWVTVHGDTTWKSLYPTIHGSTNYYDSIGEGSPMGWTDSVFVGGRTVSWQRTYDGDGDSLVLAADAGVKIKVHRDSYSELGGGVFRLDYETFGPGADGKYLLADDNELYPYNSLTVDGKGKDLVATRYGDVDGDGFFWNPATAANKAWISNLYTPTDSVTEWSDSLQQDLSGTRGATAKVTYYASNRKYADGRKLLVYSRIPGKTAFGGGDTVQIWEKTDLTGWKSHGDADSTLRVTWLIPGNLADAGDDKVAMWYAQTWNKQGAQAISSSVLFTAAVAYGAALQPKAGTYVTESRMNPSSAKSIVRSVLTKEFDLPNDVSSWRRTDFFESGDSTVSTGGGSPAGAGTYTQVLGQGAKNTGFYDAATGEFADTTSLLDFKGGEKTKEILTGTINAAKGTGDYRYQRVTNGKAGPEIHVTVVADGDGFAMTRVSAAGTATIAIHGDSAVMAKTEGGVKRTYTWSDASGTPHVSQQDKDAAGASVATGEYSFGQDLSGTGTCNKTPTGKPAMESKVQFQSDGTVFQDGVKVSK